MWRIINMQEKEFKKDRKRLEKNKLKG